jgi:hypothetical protein
MFRSNWGLELAVFMGQLRMPRALGWDVLANDKETLMVSSYLLWPSGGNFPGGT